MSYNQQYLVAAQMGHQQVQVQQHAVAEIAHQQVLILFYQIVLVRFYTDFSTGNYFVGILGFLGCLLFPEKIVCFCPELMCF